MDRLMVGWISVLCVGLAGCPADPAPGANDDGASGDDGMTGVGPMQTSSDPSATSSDPSATTATEPPDTATSNATTSPDPDTGTTGTPSGPIPCQPQKGAIVVDRQWVDLTSAGGDDPAQIGVEPAGGGVFITKPDAGPLVECDVWDQDCPAGEKCMPWGSDGGTWNATRCSPIAADPGQPGDACTVVGGSASGEDDCDIAVMCLDVDPQTNTGTCAEMCTGSVDAPVCETPDTTCTVSNAGVLILCRPFCNPLADECPSGQACYPVGDTMVCANDASGDGGAAGDGCEFINGCDPGNYCASQDAVPDCVGASGCCSPFCTVGDDSSCLPGQTCQPSYPGGAPAQCLQDVGVCAL